MLPVHQERGMVKDERPLVIITARLGSTRLPGKVLRPFWGGHSILAFLVRRLQAFPLTSRLVIASPDSPENAPITTLGESLGVPVMRGPEDDVVARMAMCVPEDGVHFIARVTADNPLTDPVLFRLQLEEMIRLQADYSYCKASLKGTAADIWTADCFRQTVANASTPYAREHANAWVWDNPRRYRTLWYAQEKVDFTEGMSVSVDTEDDLERVKSFVAIIPDPLRHTFVPSADESGV